MLNIEAQHFSTWSKHWSAIEAKGDPRPPYFDLRNRYAEPHRKYHTWKHITDGLTELSFIRNLADHPDEIAAAYYFHDAVYDPTEKDSENVEMSVLLSVVVMNQAQIPSVRRSRITDLILVTNHTIEPTRNDEKIIVDIDLSILGKGRREFDEYERNIRLEYSWVEEQAFRSGRAGILERFLQRPRIYNTPYFQEKYESQAWDNLLRSINNLRGL